MAYELAKQLKDAGFKQNVSGDGYFLMPDGTFQGPLNATSKFPQSVYVPHLHELMDACGAPGYYGFIELKGYNDRTYWKAGTWANGDQNWIFAEGSTPQEAVAKLWLAINRK
jgi:hypothetical protein